MRTPSVGPHDGPYNAEQIRDVLRERARPGIRRRGSGRAHQNHYHGGMNRLGLHPALDILRRFSGKGLCAIALWGGSFVLTRVALRSFDPFGLVALRLTVGSALLFLAARLRTGRFLPVRADIGVCVFMGFALGLHIVMQAYGLQYTTAINAGWIIGFTPVTIALGAHLLGKQKILPTGWAGVVVGALGVLLVTSSALPDFKDARFGDLLQILSCLTWTIYTLAGVDAIRRSGALRVTALTMGVAALLNAAATPWMGILSGPLTLRPCLALAFLGFLCSGLAYYLWFQAVDEHGPARTGSMLYLEPFVTSIAATATLHEPVTVNVIFGGVCVLSGVWLVAGGSHAPQMSLVDERAALDQRHLSRHDYLASGVKALSARASPMSREVRTRGTTIRVYAWCKRSNGRAG